ncbi:MAG: peptidoglycan DD-metalloendopeptidase family protein [Alphaproteobacteria bacterium]
MAGNLSSLKDWLLIGGMMALLAACGWNDDQYAYNPAAGTGSTNMRAIPQTQTQPNVNKVQDTGVHLVARNESYYSIASAYGVNLRDLIMVNQLQAPFIPFVGQRLIIPSKRLYRVQSGDTLYGIARNLQVNLSEVIRLNQLEPPYEIYPKQLLAVPASVAVAAQTASLPAAAPVKQRKVERTPAAQIKRLQNAPPQTQSRTYSQKLETVSIPQPAPAAAGKQNYTMRFSDQGNPIPPNLPPAPIKRIATSLTPPAFDPRGFMWPLKGRIVANYGLVADGLRNDGINIAAPRGTVVRAAQNGIIAYNGAELKGFGNLILIRHDDGYVTAYAHNDRAMVALGEKVKRGDVIARVGSTGSVDSPQLHFQIRKGQQKLNPKYQLKG